MIDDPGACRSSRNHLEQSAMTIRTDRDVFVRIAVESWDCPEATCPCILHISFCDLRMTFCDPRVYDDFIHLDPLSYSC